jgi:predicted amidophosphoribosyltransferase
MFVKNLTRKILNTIFPVKCVCCQKISENADSEDILCKKCRAIIDEVASCECSRCKNPPHLCRCKKVEHIEEVVFTYFYAGDKLKQAIYKVKRANLYYINEFFAKGMYNSLKLCDRIDIGGIDIVTNTPRMKSSIQFYGYNQTEALAKIIAKRAGIAYMPVLEAAKSHDTEQKSLNKAKRGQNVKNKFKIVNPLYCYFTV